MKTNNSNYDFDLIISSEDLKKNREKHLQEMVNKKRKSYIKNTILKVGLLFLIGAIMGIAIYQLFTIETVKSTPVGNYTCRGDLLEFCVGNKEVADYLGVQ